MKVRYIASRLKNRIYNINEERLINKKLMKEINR